MKSKKAHVNLMYCNVSFFLSLHIYSFVLVLWLSLVLDVVNLFYFPC